MALCVGARQLSGFEVQTLCYKSKTGAKSKGYQPHKCCVDSILWNITSARAGSLPKPCQCHAVIIGS